VRWERSTLPFRFGLRGRMWTSRIEARRVLWRL
jgi:hypothetical protein